MQKLECDDTSIVQPSAQIIIADYGIALDTSTQQQIELFLTHRARMNIFSHYYLLNYYDNLIV